MLTLGFVKFTRGYVNQKNLPVLRLLQ